MSTLEIYTPDSEVGQELPLAQNSIAAGFPSPAAEHMDLSIDLNRELVDNPASTFYARVSGLSMVDQGIDDGDLLVIDRSVEPTSGSLAVCFVDGDFTLKRFENHGDYGLLVPANPDFEAIKVTAENDFLIWGIVRYVIKKV